MAKEHCESFLEQMYEAADHLEAAAEDAKNTRWIHDGPWWNPFFQGATLDNGDYIPHVTRAYDLLWGLKWGGSAIPRSIDESVADEVEMYRNYIESSAKYVFELSHKNNLDDKGLAKDLAELSSDLRDLADEMFTKCENGDWEIGWFGTWLMRQVDKLDPYDVRV